MRNILYETDRLKIEHEFESTWLIDKLTNEILLKDDLYGDPDVALIDKNNKWAIVANKHLHIWTPEKSISLQTEEFRWIYSSRVKTEKIVEVLTDPWSETSSIWELDIETFDINKIKDFTDYRLKEYTENIVW